jgi:signal transduction histidine kinase
MPDYLVEELVIFLVAGAIAVVVISQIGASRRARAAMARDTELRQIAERVVATQEETAGRLAQVTNQLAEMDVRVATVKHILKDAE